MASICLGLNVLTPINEINDGVNNDHNDINDDIITMMMDDW